MRRRKNLVPTVLLTILSWGGLGYLIYSISPQDSLRLWLPFQISPVVLFFLLLFAACLLSFSLLFNNTRRGTLIAIGITALALLRFFHLFHPLYIVLIVGLLLTIEIYFLKSKTGS